MLTHPDTAYLVRNLQRQDLLTEAARYRLAAQGNGARRWERGGANKRLNGALLRVVTGLLSTRRVPQTASRV
jgi:hypothetical protein